MLDIRRTAEWLTIEIGMCSRKYLVVESGMVWVRIWQKWA